MRHEEDPKKEEKGRRPLTRRDFLKGTALGVAGLAWTAQAAGESNPPSPAKGPNSTVVLIRDEAALDPGHQANPKVVEEMLTRGITSMAGIEDPLAAWKKFFTPQDVVGIKVNDFPGRATHAELVQAIIKNLHAVGISDDHILTWDRVNAGRGYEGVKKRGLDFGFHPNGLSRIITDECTALINVPVATVHYLSGVAVTLKNWIGAVNRQELPSSQNPEAAFYQVHRDFCAELGVFSTLPEVKTKCRLHIVDGLRPLFHGGPQIDPRYLWDYKGILLGTDPVALDATCVRILQAKRDDYQGRSWPINPPTKHVMVADLKHGLGNSHPDRIQLVKLGAKEGSLV